MVTDTEPKATTPEAQFIAEAEAGEPQQPAAEIAAPEEAKTEGAAEPTVAELQAVLKHERDRYASILGSDRKTRQTEAVLARISAIQEAMLEHMDNPETEPGSLKKRVAQLTADETQRVTTRQTRDEWFSSIQEVIKEAGFAKNDPEFLEINRLWVEGDNDKPDLSKLHKALVYATSASVRYAKAAGMKEAKKQTVATNKEYRVLDGAGRGGSPIPSATFDALMKKDSRKMSLKELKEYDKQVDAAWKAAPH